MHAETKHIVADAVSIVDCKLTVITGVSPQRLSKSFRKLPNGEIEKQNGGQLVSAQCRVETISDLSGLATILLSLGSDNALVFGVPTNGATKVLSKKAFEAANRPTNVTQRTKEAFKYPNGAGVMMLDYDPPKDSTAPLDREGLVQAIRTAVPELVNCEMLWFPSASSCIYDGDEQLWGFRGQRLYIICEDAADIPRAGKALVNRLWLAGYGHFEVSKSGALLNRTLVDSSVWQSNRLDFAGGAECKAPLRQDRGQPFLVTGASKTIDSKTAFTDLTSDEISEVLKILNDERNIMQSEAAAIRENYLDTRIAKLGEDNPQAQTAAREVFTAALDMGVLMGEFPIQVELRGVFKTVSVAELLKDPSRYNGCKVRDPIEPDYDGGRTVGVLYLLQGRPNLHSFAHGGQTYRLLKAKKRFEVVTGHTSDVANGTLSLLRDDPLVYDFGDRMVILEDGLTHVLDQDSLALHLGDNIQFWKFKGEDMVDCDPPIQALRQILAINSRRGLRQLDAVVTAPLVLPNGEVLDTAGYHEASKLFYFGQGHEHLKVPDRPTMEQSRHALMSLMYPFKDFPYVDSLARGAMLGAILTAFLRPVLETAPAIAFDAPVQGSGKTLLADCVGFLAAGALPQVFPPTKSRDDEETRKRLMAVLLNGAKALVWDNVIGGFDSAAMASFLTAPTFTDRILGKSVTSSVPNRVFMVFTGNNIIFEGDMPRRVLICRIDPRSSEPFARQFDVSPYDYVVEHRQEMAIAACTLIKAQLLSDTPKAAGRLASFETWDNLVRQTVVWVGKVLDVGAYGDPMDLVREAQAVDPSLDGLGELLFALHDQFGVSAFTAKDVQKVCTAWNIGPLNQALGEYVGTDVSASAKSIGRKLSSIDGRISNGLRLSASTGSNKDPKSYRVEHHNNN